jgi:hypothetical protein
MGPSWRWQSWRQIAWRRKSWRQSRQYQALQFVAALGSKPKFVGAVTAIIITETVQFKSYHPIADTAKYR